MMYWTEMDSPLGTIRIVVDESGALKRLDYLETRKSNRVRIEGARRDDTRCKHVVRQLEEYYAGTRRAFDLELAPEGTPFQLEAWKALQTIPYGTTISYGEQARRMGRPNAVRAVGAANGSNPIAIVIPCHRVIGADGGLTGYASGIERKRKLLELEGALSQELRL